MTDLVTLKRRAQVIANDTRSARWIVYTSLGWRIEAAPCAPSVPHVRIDPAPTRAQPEAT